MPNKQLTTQGAHLPGVDIPTSGFQCDKDQLTETLTLISCKLAGKGSITPLSLGRAEITLIKWG